VLFRLVAPVFNFEVMQVNCLLQAEFEVSAHGEIDPLTEEQAQALITDQAQGINNVLAQVAEGIVVFSADDDTSEFNELSNSTWRIQIRIKNIRL
jgi:hypothetical protein